VKWFALIVALAAIFPFSTWLRRNPHEAPKIWMLVGFLPFVLHYFHLYMAVISYNNWPGYTVGIAPPPGETLGWPGYVEGAEVSVLDILILALSLCLPDRRRSLPFRLSMVLYFFAVLLSVFQAGAPEAALFYCWQLARMFLVYAVVTRACVDPKVVPAILKGMAASIMVQLCIVIWQRFGLGILRTPGTLSHENLLGLMCEFGLFPFFALLVSGRGGWLSLAVTLASSIIAVLTVSRAAIGLAGLGFAAVIVISALWEWNSRKALILLFGGAALLALTPLALSSIEQRDIRLSSDFERMLLNKEAANILSDHPFGVGANQYVMVANEGYRQEAGQFRQQIGLGTTEPYVIVHNTYMLVAAETGYPGLIAFILLLACPLIVAFRCGWQNRGDQGGNLLLGLGVALLIVYIHCFFEWVFLVFESQYMYALDVGMVAGLAQQLGYWRKDARLGSLIRATRSLFTGNSR
jgi:O-antigen ligase